MAEGSRRPLVVLGILAVLAVALFGFGVAAGPRGADAEWPDPFGSFRPGDALRPLRGGVRKAGIRGNGRKSEAR